MRLPSLSQRNTRGRSRRIRNRRKWRDGNAKPRPRPEARQHARTVLREAVARREQESESAGKSKCAGSSVSWSQRANACLRSKRQPS
jgi:hypothetical protein